MNSKLKEHKRKLSILFIVLFTISLLFPVIASITNKKGEILPVVGFFDVTIAVCCFGLFITLTQVVEKSNNVLIGKKIQKINEYLSSLPLLLIVLFLMQFEINWPILLLGLGWRYWLLTMTIPYLVEAFSKAGTISGIGLNDPKIS